MHRRKVLAVALSDWYKYDEDDKIWWRDDTEAIGAFLFSFDKKQTFNFFEDYPDKLTEEQRALFRKENPVLARLKEGSNNNVRP